MKYEVLLEENVTYTITRKNTTRQTDFRLLRNDEYRGVHGILLAYAQLVNLLLTMRGSYDEKLMELYVYIII